MPSHTKKRILVTVAVMGAGMWGLMFSAAADRHSEQRVVVGVFLCALPLVIVATAGLILWHLHSASSGDLPPQMVEVGMGCAVVLYFVLLCPLSMWIDSLWLLAALLITTPILIAVSSYLLLRHKDQ